MRQTLLRIPLEEPWSLGPLGEVPGFGFGLVLLLWGLFGAWWLYRNVRAEGFSGEFVPNVIVWSIVAAVILWVPTWVAPKTLRIVSVVPQPEQPAQDSEQVTLRNVTDAQVSLDDWRLINESEHDVPLRGVVPPQEQLTIALRAGANFLSDRGDTLTLVDPGGHPRHSMRYSRGDVAPGQAVFDPGKFVPIYGYGFMLFLGFMAGGWTATRRAQRVGMPPEILWDVAMWLFISGIAGARLFYLIQYSDRVFANAQTPLDYLRAAVNLPDGGLVLLGGVMLGFTAYFLFCRVRKVHPLPLADIVIPSFFVGLAFGRLGCFLNGCCYGDVCSLPWAVTFPQDSVPYTALVAKGFLSPDAAGSLSLHPTQLYSSINALVLALLTGTYFKFRRRDGEVLALGLIIYPITRYVIEILRFDEPGRFGTSLTISQWISIGMLPVGLALAFWIAKRGELRVDG